MTHRRRWFTAAVLTLIGLAVPCAYGDEILFGGGSGGTAEVTGNVLDPSFHQFTLSSAPLSALLINGTSVSFSGFLNIDATGHTTDSSGNLVFTSGNLNVMRGANTEVASSLIAAGFGLVNNVPTFLGVLDPSSTTFGDLLASEGPLLAGIGGTQFSIELPVINPPIVGFAGTPLQSGVVLVTAPEPSGFVLFGSGLVGLLVLITLRRLSIAGARL